MPDPISDSRRKAVDAAREAWTRRLVDTSRRNNLLYFRDLRVGTLDFSAAKPGALEELLMGAKVPLSALVPDDVRAVPRLETLVRKARSNREERGLETLYLAYGMATWPVEDGGRPPEAAAVLLPLAVEGKTSPMIVRSGPPRPNLALLHVLEELGYEPDLDEESEDAVMMLGRLQASVPLDGFRVVPRAVVGNFSFQKLAMVRDLENADALAAHDGVAALAGDRSARMSIAARRVSVDPRTLDTLAPETEFLPLDADSSQQAVVQAVASGSDGVVQGPPGCGKSQTIANLVATLAAQGKRVLFVAEKRAALEAVLKRLEAVGLGHLALDLHGATVSQKAVVARIGETLAAIRESPDPDEDALNARFADRRARLVAHERRMHTPVAPANRSPYALQNAVLGSKIDAKTRWRGPDLGRLTADAANRIGDLLDEAMGHPELSLRRGPWANVQLVDGASVQAALDALASLLPWIDELIRMYAEICEPLEPERLPDSPWRPEPSETFASLGLLVEHSRERDDFLRRYKPEIFSQARGLAHELAPGERSSIAKVWAFLTNGRYREALKRFRGLALDGQGNSADLDRISNLALSLENHWEASGIRDRFPQVPEALGSLTQKIADALARLPSPLNALDRVWLGQLVPEIQSLLGDSASARAVPRIRAIEAEIESLGASRILQEIRSEDGSPWREARPEGGTVGEGVGVVEARPEGWLRAPAWKTLGEGVGEGEISPSPSGSSWGGEQGGEVNVDREWRSLFEDAWLRSCYDAVLVDHPELAAFSGAAQTALEREFADLDRERTRLAAPRVRRAHAESAVKAMNRFPEQTDAVRAETQKRSRHKPLRRLLAEAPDVLTTVLPCWMASPLNVSGLLPPEPIFDVVVFDEASQILPEDAIGAVLRGKRLVVVGDRHQLPPTVFFADGGDEEEDDAPTAGFQSLLDNVGAFLEPWPLLWHYRSRDERLIAFSNHFVYDDRLVTFPGVGGAPCVDHVRVTSSLLDDDRAGVPDEESSSAEVAKVVELVLAHAENRPEMTLGVIAMGLKHAQRIEVALDRALDDRPELEPFFDPKRPDRFFVKNLEQVQGDERDAILISIGYGKDASGRLPYRFGPLLQDGGERRLNVAVTRARRRMILVSSFSHLDMDPSRSKARGVQLLREFLQFAATSGASLVERSKAETVIDSLANEVVTALEARGVPLTPGLGVGGYRLDFAAIHPEGGRFVLAIESDGLAYHAAPTARDRDRLRQQQLESIGWRFHRLWSTDWLRHRDREIEAIVQAWNEAVATEPVVLGPLVSLPEKLMAAPPPPPVIARRDDVEDVPQAELDALIVWILADGLRTDDEIVEEASDRLGYARVGAKIDRVLRASIARVRASRP